MTNGSKLFLAHQQILKFIRNVVSVLVGLGGGGWVGLENKIGIFRRLLYTHTDLQSFTKVGIQ